MESSGGMAGAGPVLILGGSGFLGAHLVAEALARFAGRRTVVSASRDPGAAPAPGVAADAFQARRVDALAAGELEAALEDLAPAGIVLATALSRVGDCERYPGLARELNVRLPERVAGWCAARGRRLVHVSTDLVFGGVPPAGERYSEDDPPSPVHVYGETKAAGEALALERGATVCRLPLLFGDSGGRGLGASDQVAAAVARGDRPTLFTDEWRTPLDVGDAARAVLELLELPFAGRLHVAGPERIDRHALGRLVLAANGLPADGVDAGTRADLGLEASRPADVSLDASRARALLSTPLRSPADALRARSA